jgi:tetratricopeptide (TPR) repeat protein
MNSPTPIPRTSPRDRTCNFTRKRPQGEALALFCQALLAEDDADTEKALARYRKVLELDPASADIAVKVALELARRNDVPGAIQVLKDTIKAAPKEVLPMILLSQLYAKQLKKPELALKYAEQALATEPQNSACYLAVFDLHMAASDPAKAEAVLDKGAKVGNTDGKFWAQLGKLYSRLYFKEDWSCLPEQQQKMNGIYRRAAELAGDDASILSEVGDYFVLSKQVKEAIPYYLKVIASPQAEKDLLLSNTRQKLARAFIVNQQRDEAIEVLEKMAKEDSMRFDTYELLGNCSSRRGVRQGAAQLRAQPAARRQPATELSAPDLPTAPDEEGGEGGRDHEAGAKALSGYPANHEESGGDAESGEAAHGCDDDVRRSDGGGGEQS